jgi:hypothetical protein
MLGCRRTEGAFMNLVVKAWLPLDWGCRLGGPNQQTYNKGGNDKGLEKKGGFRYKKRHFII